MTFDDGSGTETGYAEGNAQDSNHMALFFRDSTGQYAPVVYATRIAGTNWAP